MGTAILTASSTLKLTFIREMGCLKKNKLFIIENWKHRNLTSQIVTSTAELLMQLFMQRTAQQGWTFAAAHASESLHRDASAAARQFGFLLEQLCALFSSGVWMSQYCCLSVQNPRAWEQDKKKMKKNKANAKSLYLGPFASMYP